MSTITRAYDNLLELVQVALPEHKRLLNVYQPEQNPEANLLKGVGIVMGSASRADLVDFTLGVERNFSFVITRKVFALDSAADKRASSEKNIIEDQVSVLKLLLKEFKLRDAVLMCEYAGDGGIEYLELKQGQHLKLNTNLKVQYLEQLT